MNNYDWIRANANLFLDQNITIGYPNMLRLFMERGYKKIATVSTFGYDGANDGKLLGVIKEKKMILITFDKKFSKMANKYHNRMCILCKHQSIAGPGNLYSGRTVFKKIQENLILNYAQIKRYYEENGI